MPNPRPELSRRHLLGAGGALGAGALLRRAAAQTPDEVAELQARVAELEAALRDCRGGLWPGHQPGATYIGLNGVSDGLDYPEAVERWFGQWTSETAEHSRVVSAHLNDRLPWVSFKGPSGGAAAILSGAADAAIAGRAARFRGYELPVLATYHHEPWGDFASPAQFEQAFFHIADRFALEGGTGPVTFCPIFNGFNLHVAAGGAYFASGQFAERCPLVAMDHYGLAGEIEQALDALRGYGAQSVGVGEFGRGEPDPSGNGTAHTVTQYRAKLDVFRENRDFLAVVCYWNQAVQTFSQNDPYPNGAAYQALWSEFQLETVRLSDL